MATKNTQRSAPSALAPDTPAAPANEAPLRGERPVSRSGPHLVADNPGHEQQLSRVVELEIIPRLLMMHANTPPIRRVSKLVITDAHVSTLAELAVDDDARSASRFVQALAEAGASPQQILLDLLSPCAVLMGTWWCEDLYDFTQVTIGLCRLQQALNEQAARVRPVLAAGAPRLLLVTAPGSQHSFGVALVAECFALAGWEVDCAPGLSWSQTSDVLAQGFFDVLGVSVSCDADVASVRSAIVGLRQVSINQGLGVLVGGPVALACDELATRCGADGQAAKADAAIDWAQAWLDRRACHRDVPGAG